jgi:tRNA G10  N-methylase Trm11
MEYKYSPKENFEDLSSGRVIYGNHGIPNYPVRLVNEIYRRCLAYSAKKENIKLYDPCCGGAYLLTVLGFCNQNTISTIYASDIDDSMVKYASKNLSLLSPTGINERINELEALANLYHKQSHNMATESAYRLKEQLIHEINVHVFKADATKKIPLPEPVDIIITDIPYGNLVDWQGDESAFSKMINELINIATPETILAISMDKKQGLKNDRLIRLEKNNIGKRKFEIYRLA